MTENPFTKRLKLLRNRNAATQATVAEKAQISWRQYQRYEAGENEPTLSVLLRLADFFDVSLDYLAGRSDAPERR